MTIGQRLGFGLGVAIGAAGVLPVALERLEIGSGILSCEAAEVMFGLYFYLLPLTMVLCAIGVFCSIDLLRSPPRDGAVTVVAAWVFAASGTGVFVWWIVDALSGLGSLGG